MSTRRGARVVAASVAAVTATIGMVACSNELDDVDAGATAVAPGQDEGCAWTMAGQNLARTHASACDGDDAVGSDTLDRLEQVWFAETLAEVTGAPAVTADAVYFGDWSGRIYALDRETGEERWTRDTPPHAEVYAGQIPASPTVTEVGGQEVLVIASGRTVHLLTTADGAPVWERTLGDPDDDADPTEIQGSPAVTDELVIVPTDVHNDPERRSGVVALSIEDGSTMWSWDPEAGHPGGGCGSVWGTPSVDVAGRLVVVGTGSCYAEETWNDHTEAIVGLDLDTGEPRWSYQPRTEVNNQDWDFAGAANLFEIDGRGVAGLGNKDGYYYVVDRSDGALVWRAEAIRQPADGDRWAFGGFIGATAIAPDDEGRLVVAGGTAVGDCPCAHGFDAATGDVMWQSSEPSGTYGASGAAGGVVFASGVDQTLRAFDLRSGEVRWDRPLRGLSASGPSIAGDFLAIGVGFREPGAAGSASGGVHGFRVLDEGESPPTSASTTVPEGPSITALQAGTDPCLQECELDFTLKDPPEGRSPTATLRIQADPLSISITTTDLGDPAEWLRPGGTAEQDGATVLALFITPRDDRPELGSIVCVLDAAGACSGEHIDIAADQFTRISLLALVDPDTPPTLQEGFDRLVTTRSFDPPLLPEA